MIIAADNTTRKVAFGEILTDKQIEHVLDILKQHHDFDGRVHALRAYYRSIKDHLRKQGILPDYLAYVTAFTLHPR